MEKIVWAELQEDTVCGRQGEERAGTRWKVGEGVVEWEMVWSGINHHSNRDVV